MKVELPKEMWTPLLLSITAASISSLQKEHGISPAAWKEDMQARNRSKVEVVEMAARFDTSCQRIDHKAGVATGRGNSFKKGHGEMNEWINETLNDPQPEPDKDSLHPPIWPLVMVDILKRDIAGEKKYGTRLRGFNGRDPLVDLYQELLDAVVYFRQAIYERDRLGEQ